MQTSSSEASREDLERAVLIARELRKRLPWQPSKGTQEAAYRSQATVIGFGGSAGGGKTDLGIGLALTLHSKSLIVRREATQLVSITDRINELLHGQPYSYNGSDRIWRIPPAGDLLQRQIELGSMQQIEDWVKYMGRPHDLLVIDEGEHFAEIQVRALMGWLRSPLNIRCRALITFNPPSNEEGMWLLKYFAPWLVPGHPRAAADGELRYYTTIDGEEYECQRDSGRFWSVQYDGKLTRLRDIADGNIKPQSRTFIRSKLSDNPYLSNTGYASMLSAMPEPLRSQLLNGDFTAGRKDGVWQLIPSAWVDAAMARWERKAQKPPMDAVGVDVSRGGADETIIARRHGMWFDVPIKVQKIDTNDGYAVAAAVLAHTRDSAAINIDVAGVGSSPYDCLSKLTANVHPIDSASAATQSDRSGRLRFLNMRAQMWWAMRDALDPASNTGICLPPDDDLKYQLCAMTWSPEMTKIRMERSENIRKRVGRSLDHATAYVMALIDHPRIDRHLLDEQTKARREYNPFACINN